MAISTLKSMHIKFLVWCSHHTCCYPASTMRNLCHGNKGRIDVITIWRLGMIPLEKAWAMQEEWCRRSYIASDSCIFFTYAKPAFLMLLAKNLSCTVVKFNKYTICDWLWVRFVCVCIAGSSPCCCQRQCRALWACSMAGLLWQRCYVLSLTAIVLAEPCVVWTILKH